MPTVLTKRCNSCRISILLRPISHSACDKHEFAQRYVRTQLEVVARHDDKSQGDVQDFPKRCKLVLPVSGMPDVDEEHTPEVISTAASARENCHDRGGMQIVLEMVEVREVDTARAMLRQTAVFATLRQEQPDRFLRLEQLCGRTYFDIRSAWICL